MFSLSLSGGEKMKAGLRRCELLFKQKKGQRH
jgi:hypothetical protein